MSVSPQMLAEICEAYPTLSFAQIHDCFPTRTSIQTRSPHNSTKTAAPWSAGSVHPWAPDPAHMFSTRLHTTAPRGQCQMGPA